MADIDDIDTKNHCLIQISIKILNHG